MTHNRDWWQRPNQSDRDYPDYGRCGPIEDDASGALAWTVASFAIAAIVIGYFGWQFFGR